MSMCRGRSIAGAVAVLAAVLCLGASAIAATGATKDEAVTMVKKAVGAIKSDGTRKAYAEISDHGGLFVDRDLYIVVYNLDGLVLAHGADEKRIGTNQIDDKDADGKTFVKERLPSPRRIKASGSNTSS